MATTTSADATGTEKTTTSPLPQDAQASEPTDAKGTVDDRTDNRDYGTAYGSCSCGDCTDAENAGRGSVPLSCDRRKQQCEGSAD